MSKRKHTDEPPNIKTPSTPSQIFTSTPIHDRSSTFTAIFTPSTGTPRSHQRHGPFDSADHKILAWRKPSSQKSLSGAFTGGGADIVVYETNSDDDGEKYAGKKLEKVLSEMGVVGTVVVARWYGGIMLGPVRFKWIEDCAREAIGLWKATEGQQVKKVKVDEGEGMDEARQKEVLVRVLRERDASVGVLRGLLAEKNEELVKLERVDLEDAVEGDGEKRAEGEKNSAAAIVEYDSMSLQQLKQLEKARDATLGWILKQIDSAEEKIKGKKESKGEVKG